MGVRQNGEGFSLLELLIVIAIVLIVSAISIIQVGPALNRSTSDAALQTTLGTLRRVHELAIDQRRQYRVSFVPPRTIQTDMVMADGSGNRTFVSVGRVDLPRETQFVALDGLPTASGTTPDGLGVGRVAIDFGVDYGGGGTEIYFQPDGRALDSANRLNNGLVYVARPSDLMSSGAVSVLGASGRIKGWRLVKNGDFTEWRP